VENITVKRERVKLTPEQLFGIFMECISAGAPVKQILERYGLKAWDLVAIRKKVREAALEALSGNLARGRRKSVVPLEQYQNLGKELAETKEALSAIGYEFALLKKRVNLV